MPYFGGKQMVASRLVSLFPPHAGYIEPYMGGLSVLLAKPVEAMEVVNDINGDLVTFWRVLRDCPEELIVKCVLTPHSLEEYRGSYDRDAVGDVEVARRVWVLLSQGRSSSWVRSGWRFYLNPNNTQSMGEKVRSYKRRLPDVAARLMNVSIECRSALDVIQAYGREVSNLLYVDPPYLGSTRKAVGYADEMRGEQDHLDLLTVLRGVRAKVVVSGYDSELYDHGLPGWTKRHMRSRTQGSSRCETVWMNYTPDNVLDLTQREPFETPFETGACEGVPAEPELVTA